MKNKKTLIIGGTGFLGYHLALHLIKRNDKVTSISLRKPRKYRKIKKVKYLVGDISKKKILSSLLLKRKFDYIINFGGYVDHSNNSSVYKTHYLGTKNLYEIFKNKNIKSFIQIGSSSEYGNLKSPHYEEQNGKPNTLYGQSKLKSTNFLLNESKKYNFPVTIVRLYQVYGPKQDNNRFIPQLIQSCINKKKFLTSSGNQFRDFLYVDDVIRGIILCTKTKKSHGKIINLGNGRPIQLKKIMKIAKKEIKYFNPIFGKLKLRKGELKSIFPSIKLAKKTVKWKARLNFTTGFKKTMKYYKKEIR